MAYSFCCAPLHAVRHFAPPPQGAERFRVVWPGWGQPRRIVVAANLTAKSSSPIALGGYRPQGSQVAGKGPRNRAERVEMPTLPRPPKRSAAVSLDTQSALAALARRDQALALVSTARAGRSA